ncbi:MAG: ABC transporter ATP-binding protein, partial [Acidimicrobiales bacterium]
GSIRANVSFARPDATAAEILEACQLVGLGDLLDTDPSVIEQPDAIDLPAIEGEITFQGVEFGYVPGQPVLRELDLTIAAGETFAFVGETGAGKSTIAKLVNRLYDPTAGRVLLDGIDVRDVTLASVRAQVGTVPQEAFLFGGSIRANVSFARPDATAAEILEACQLVGLGDLLDRLPDGIDTPVHERGVSLSSGERQLLALARAFLAQPRILVLDEATSNLDLRSEAKIETALDTLLEGRTAILIAHRLATAMRADRIAVIHEGHIAELGTHAQLVAQGGRYAAMVASWDNHH